MVLTIQCRQSDVIDKPTSLRASEGNQQGLRWLLPHNITTHREDVDKRGNTCFVYDAVFHPKVLRLASTDSRFKQVRFNPRLTLNLIRVITDHFEFNLQYQNISVLCASIENSCVITLCLTLLYTNSAQKYFFFWYYIRSRFTQLLNDIKLSSHKFSLVVMIHAILLLNLLQMIITTSFDGIESRFAHHKLDRSCNKQVRMSYKVTVCFIANFL